MNISTKKLRKLIQEELFYREFYGKKIIKEAGLDGNDPVIIKNIAGKTIDAAWSDSGLTMWIHADDKPILNFSSRKEVGEMINMLEELLAGPMRTSR
jgi:hypothetical protein